VLAENSLVSKGRGQQIVDLIADALTFLKLDGSRVMANDLDLAGNDILTTNASISEFDSTTLRIMNRAKTLYNVNLYLQSIRPLASVDFLGVKVAEIIARNESTARINLTTRYPSEVVVAQAIDGEFIVYRCGNLNLMAGNKISGSDSTVHVKNLNDFYFDDFAGVGKGYLGVDINGKVIWLTNYP